MPTATAAAKLLVAAYAVLFCLVRGARDPVSAVQDCASSCGSIRNISYPFRLNTDPSHCGDKKYELACQDDALVLHLQASKRDFIDYRVQAINYNNFTIRLVDPSVFMDNCTLLFNTSHNAYEQTKNMKYIRNRLLSLSYTHYGYKHYGYIHTYNYLSLVSCPFPLPGKLDEFNSSCGKVTISNSDSASSAKRYWYAFVGEFSYSALENSCRIEYKSRTSLLPEGANNISYKDVNNSFAYGFEMSWAAICCSSEGSRKYHCIRGQYICYNRWSENPVGLMLSQILLVYAMYRALLCFCGIPCVTIFLIRKWRRRHLSAYDNIEEFLNCHESYLMPVRYSYSEIKKMTKNFKEKLGKGGYGSVYKGKLRSGSFAAVKMLDKSKGNGEDFINEVATIGRIHHANVVQLIGFCVKGSKRALVYEFMANGSLDKYLFFKEGSIPISNQKIYEISIGVAQGIKYLHQGCDMQILHFDIKPHNILLDENFIPKISDFGLAKLRTTDNSIVSLTAARGTIGYMAPELFYKNIGSISYKADVYSYGMLLMEMIGRRKNLNAFTEHSSRIYFPSWIYDQISAEKDIKLGDEPQDENKLVKKMIIVALWCIQLNPKDRPSMHKVIEMLEGDVEHLQMPPKPFVLPQEAQTNDAGLVTSSAISIVDGWSNCPDKIQQKHVLTPSLYIQ